MNRYSYGNKLGLVRETIVEESVGLINLDPRDDRPITLWSDRDAAAKAIAEGVIRAVIDLQQRRTRAGHMPPPAFASPLDSGPINGAWEPATPVKGFFRFTQTKEPPEKNAISARSTNVKDAI